MPHSEVWQKEVHAISFKADEIGVSNKVYPAPAQRHRPLVLHFKMPILNKLI